MEAHVANEARMLSVLTRAEQASLDGIMRKLLASFLADLHGEKREVEVPVKVAPRGRGGGEPKRGVRRKLDP